ncbi:MAG: hypothetical protein KKG00_12920 [Bacteroidetes bacterium]|nr:hypothetical protein [Bacteroidota bacterium]
MDNKEFKEKVLKGLDLTFQKLIQEKSKEDRTLVFEEDGKIIRVKARDLIK